MNLQTFLVESYQFELDRFRAALDAIPETDFHKPKLGHSPAWHALHIAEWLRFFPLQDFSATYAHLGWENADWLPKLLGPPPVAENASKAEVLAELARVTAQMVTHIQDLSDEQLSDVLLAPAAPDGKRVRLVALRIALSHIPYHRGQLLLGQKA